MKSVGYLTVLFIVVKNTNKLFSAVDLNWSTSFLWGGYLHARTLESLLQVRLNTGNLAWFHNLTL